MNLREAIKLGEHMMAVRGDALDALLAAAKGELEREEKEQPKRRDPVIVEGVLRNHAQRTNPDDRVTYLQAANALKALREKVVPYLRIKLSGEHGFHAANEAGDLLRALGEEP